MKIQLGSESINAIIERQLKCWQAQKNITRKKMAEESEVRLLITVSRAMGALGEEVAGQLSRLTGLQLFDKEILETIAGDAKVQTQIVELLDESALSDLKSWFKGSMTGKIFGKTDYLKSLTKAVGAVMKHGDAIIVGRGANILLGPKRGFHVRIIASNEKRFQRVAEQKNLPLSEAKKIVKESDKQRAVFIKDSFGSYMGDSAYYDMIINTDFLDVKDVAELILLGFSRKKFHLQQSI